MLAGVLAVITRGTRPYWYSMTAAATALALALAYLSLEICTLFHGPVLTEGATSDAEQYTYSAVWLLFGVALLAAGIFLRSLPLRAASAAVVVLTVLKVFLIDMSDLTGIYRALSFLGLGAVLDRHRLVLSAPAVPPPVSSRRRLPARGDRRRGRKLWSARPESRKAPMNDTDAKIHDKTVTGNYFEDFKLGQEIVHATPRTVTVGDVSLFTALYGSRFAVQSSDAFAQDIGYPRSPIDDLLVFHIVIGKTVPDISRNAIANLGYAEFRFLAPVYPGDTLASTSKVIGVKENSNKKSGTVYVRSTGRNQRGQPVLSYARWVMVNKRDVDAPAPDSRGARACRERRSGDARRGAAAARPRRLRLCARRLAQALGRLPGRRQDRPCRRADHRGGRASARHPPVPEHRARAFQSACRGQGPLRAPPRLWRPHHLHRALA